MVQCRGLHENKKYGFKFEQYLFFFFFYLEIRHLLLSLHLNIIIFLMLICILKTTTSPAYTVVSNLRQLYDCRQLYSKLFKAKPNKCNVLKYNPKILLVSAIITNNNVAASASHVPVNVLIKPDLRIISAAYPINRTFNQSYNNCFRLISYEG